MCQLCTLYSCWRENMHVDIQFAVYMQFSVSLISFHPCLFCKQKYMNLICTKPESHYWWKCREQLIWCIYSPSLSSGFVSTYTSGKSSGTVKFSLKLRAAVCCFLLFSGFLEVSFLTTAGDNTDERHESEPEQWNCGPSATQIPCRTEVNCINQCVFTGSLPSDISFSDPAGGNILTWTGGIRYSGMVNCLASVASCL